MTSCGLAIMTFVYCFFKARRVLSIFLDGYCSTVQGLPDWFEVDLGFTKHLSLQSDLYTAFSKHVECCNFFLAGLCGTKKMKADTLTESLLYPSFRTHRNMMCGPHWNTQHTATYYTLQLTAHCNTLQHTISHSERTEVRYAMSHCNKQHTATQCNTVQHSATQCNTKHSATHCNTPFLIRNAPHTHTPTHT